MERIFNEKYRPTEFEDVIGLDKEIPKLTRQNNIPHLLFVGPPGTGKTTTAKIIINKMGADVLVLNASKERGIDVIREKIEPFASKMSDRLKIVFLDECDATTPAFQTALRNFMEQYSNSTRFIATCNYVNKIIEPLQSRFSVFHFFKYDDESIRAHLDKIIKGESIQITPGALQKLIVKYRDDIRGMINYLNKNKEKSIVEEDISTNTTALKILARLKNKEWQGLREELLNENVDYSDLITEIENVVYTTPQLPIDLKIRVNKLCADYQYKSYFSYNKELNFAAFMAELMVVI